MIGGHHDQRPPRPLGLEIVDAQVHANQIAPGWAVCSLDVAVAAAVSAMDAVGVSTLVHDEVTGVDSDQRVLPGHAGPEGVWRADSPFAHAAVAAHPDRFAFVGRVDKHDPEIEREMGRLAETPGCVGLRIAYVPDQIPEIDDGSYDRYLALAARYRLPVFASVSRRPEVLCGALDRWPELTVILDHTGVDYHGLRTAAERQQGLERVLRLARHRNLAVKWCHVERLALEPYPFPDGLTALRRVVDAFGADRVLWASDCVESRNPERSDFPVSWAQTLHYMLDAPQFSAEEKAWLLGRSARTMLRWSSAGA